MPGVLSAHDQHFQEAFADIAKFIRCEQTNVVNTIEFCKTEFKCGMTIVPMPNGVVLRVMTVVKTANGDNFCSPIIYREVSWPDVECLGRMVMARVGQAPALPSTLPLGFTAADAATDNKCGRARAGIWCKHQGNIYIAPYIQSVEKVVIEWNGIKTEWADGDPMNEEQDYKLTVQHYCQFAHERDYGSPEKSGYYKGLYDHSYAELMWTCENRLQVRETKQCSTQRYCRNLLHPVVEEQGIAEVPKDLVLAHVGDIANGSSVHDLVKGMSPDAVLNSGNLSLDTAGNYDASIGQHWLSFILPYYGIYDTDPTSIPTTNKFWPAPGSGDWATNGLIDWLAFFPTPENRRYYDVCLWPVHLFFYDSETEESDGVVEGSTQAQWLQAKMLLSPAPWKIVVLFGNPWASGAPGGSTWPTTLRLPFKSWGANLVLSAGLTYYERLLVNGLTFIVNGCGGSDLITPANSPISQSQFLRTGTNGAGKITASKTQLEYDFIDLDGAIVDSIIFKK